MSRRGFSLVELLVVITVLAILAGLVIPAVTLVRDGARSAGCLSNLRQVGICLMLHAEDDDGQLPAGYERGYRGDWQRTLIQWLEAGGGAASLHCPAAPIPGGRSHYIAHFNLFPDLTKQSGLWRVRRGLLDELRSDLVLVFDGAQNPVSGSTAPLAWNQSGMWEFIGSADDDQVPAFGNPIDVAHGFTARWRHRGTRANFLFGDGHVASHAHGALSKGNFRCERRGRRHGWESWIR